MAYDNIHKRSNADNCAEHMWPRSGRPGGSVRSIGRTEYVQCNNCLAYRFVFEIAYTKPGDPKVYYKTCTKIVEPNFSTDR